MTAIKPMFSGEVASGFRFENSPQFFRFRMPQKPHHRKSEGSFSSNSLPRSVSMIFALLGWLVPYQIASESENGASCSRPPPCGGAAEPLGNGERALGLAALSSWKYPGGLRAAAFSSAIASTRRRTGGIVAQQSIWLYKVYPETRGDPSTNASSVLRGRPWLLSWGSLSGSPVSAFRWCREDRLADRARSAPVAVQPPRRRTRRAPRRRRARQGISASASVPPTGEPISIDNKLR